MSEILLLIFEIIGTVAFSISGAMLGVKKGMDIFGIIILGLTTAVGGGVIRDIILGITPPYHLFESNICYNSYIDSYFDFFAVDTEDFFKAAALL